MAQDRFYIAPYDQKSGQQTNFKPFLIPDEAFEELTNAYVFRGRVRKRFGSRWLANDPQLSRFRISVGTTAGGNISGNVRTLLADAGMPTAIGQSFSVGSILFTVFNPAPGDNQMLRSDGSGAPATYNLATSAFNITGTGAPNGTIGYFYPAFPVMGLLTYEQQARNDEFVVGFDTRYAYSYSGGWSRIASEATAGAAVWTGSNSQFFWGTTWTGANGFEKVFFVTNFNENEPNFMRYLLSAQWNNFNPAIDGSNYLFSAQIIVPFKNRLVVFNTWEGAASPGDNYPNRCRYSQIGSPLDVNAWRQDIPGRGNAIDAPTVEAIVTVEFVKDRLIVFFEQSTWELVYTRNQAYPFVWQQINTELGAESTFSIVPFDKVALGVGNVGIMACNGTNTERIDQKIPQSVFDIHNADGGIDRVYGIRDYTVEMVYWTFPDTDASGDFPFPNRVLIYNYLNGTWAFNEDSITAFGYFQPTNGLTWDSTTVTWDDDVTWGSGTIQALFRNVLGGNQQGYTFLCDPDVATNAGVLLITNMTVAANLVTVTSINHNLRDGEYVHFEGVTGTGNLTLLNDKIFQVENGVTINTFNFVYSDTSGTILAGTYSGGGVIARVSNITIKTKEYNFYAQSGRNAYISKVDFMVDTTPVGAIDVEFFVSTSQVPLLQDSAQNGTLLGTGTLDTFPYTATAAPIPFEAQATRVWHPVYFQADGEVVQLQLQMNDAQMRNPEIRKCGFTLHALCIYAQATSSRFQ